MRLNFLILFIILFSSSISAELRLPFEAINSHRDWMKQNFPKPAGLTEEELMLTASQIIDLRLQEPEAFDILVSVAQKVPEITEYINWTATLDCDTLCLRKRNALNGMIRYLENVNPGCYASRKLQNELYFVESMFRDVTSDYRSLIKIQEEVCSKDNESREKALLLLMKLQCFEVRSTKEQVDNPLHYAELWELEKEVLKLYPASSSVMNDDRMLLYERIGSLKVMPSEKIMVELMLDDDTMYDNGTMYNYIGTYKDYPCNTGFYLQKALEIGIEIYGENHPATLAALYFATQFYVYNITLDEETTGNARFLSDWFSLYYPQRSIESSSALLLKSLVDFQNSGSFNLSEDKRKTLEECSRIYYGETNPYYLNTLSQITLASVYNDDDFNSALSNFERQSIKVFPDDKLTPLVWLSNIYSQIKFRDPEAGKKKMDELKNRFLRHHNGSPLSFYLGKQLANYYSGAAFDFDTSVEIYNALIDDTQKLFGNPSAIYYLIRLNHFQASATGINDSEIRIIDNLLSEIQEHEFKSKPQILHTVLSNKAIYLWDQAKYADAHKVYSQIINSTGIKSKFLEERSRDALCRLRGNVDTNQLENFVSDIEKDIAVADTLSISPYILIDLGNYFSETNHLDKSIKYLELALNAHNLQTNYSLDDEYFQISGKLASLYDLTDNRVAAARLVTNDRECLRDSKHLFPSLTLADYLLESYYRANSRQDMASAIFYLTTFSNIYQQIIFSSGNADAIKFNLGVKWAQAATQLYVTLDGFIRNYSKILESAEMQQFDVSIDQIKGIFNQWIPELKTFMKEVYNDFPKYDPGYKSNPMYKILLVTFGAFYQSCEPDYDKAEKYLLMALDLSQNDTDKKDIYFFLSGLMNTAGNLDKHEYYLDRAYSLVDNASITNSTDRLGSIAYKFKSALKKKDLSTATQKAREIYSENRRMLDSNFQLMSSSEQDQYFNTFGDPAWALVNLLEYTPETIAKETYNAVIYRTGMQLRSQQEIRKLIASSPDQEIRILADSINSLKAEHKLINITPDLWNTQLGTQLNNKAADLTFRIEHLEMQLLDRLAKDRSSNQEITWEMIRETLKPNQAAIEFLLSDSKIMALIVKPGCDAPIAVKLGGVMDLMEGLNSLKAKNSATLATRLYGKNSSVNLYQLLWEPLEKSIADCKTIFFTAPGILHTIAFNAIETPDGQYLIDKYDLHQLTNTAQLTLPVDDSAPESAALLGDVLFDPAQIKSVGIIPEKSGERAVENDYSLNEFDTRGVARQYFRYLPFTGKELSDISETFAGKNIECVVRDKATENALRNLCKNAPEVLHFATHGFFISSEAEALSIPFMKRHLSHLGSAMQRSGIALANAELSWKGTEKMPEENDGILTANEVSNLNLKNTRLVTLSACETALGDYNFEGIHGLTRGFKQAGANSLLVSLWSVNDQSTALFMTTFYRCWIQTGDRHLAYRKAMEHVRATHPSPFYWAPFILLD